MKKVYDPKSPEEVLKYAFNWSPRNIGSEVILTSAVTVVSGSVVIANPMTEDVPSARDGQGTTFIASEGVDGEMCELFLEAVTDAGSELEDTVYLPIRQK